MENASRALAIFLAHAIQVLLGLGTGLIINTYIKLIGLKFGGENSQFAGYIALAICFAIELLLEVRHGAVAEIHGSRATFVLSFLFRSAFPLILIAALLVPSRIVAAVLVLLSLLVFAIGFTLFSGNFESWLRAHCSDGRLSERAFAGTRGIFYLGLLTGSLVAVWRLPVEQTELIANSIPVYVFASIAGVVAACACFLVSEREEYPGVLRSMLHVAVALRSVLFEWKRPSNIEKQVAKDLSCLPNLNAQYWFVAFAYGATQLVEVSVPLFVLSKIGSDFVSNTARLTIIACLWTPPLLGAITKVLRKSDGESHNTTYLPRLALLFLLSGCLIPICAYFGFLYFGISILVCRFAWGQLDPSMHNLITTVSNASSKYPKAMLSIAERRKKIGAGIALVLTGTVASLFPSYQIAPLCVLPVLFAGLLFLFPYCLRVLGGATECQSN